LSRTVQLELTLEIEVECDFSDGSWEPIDIISVHALGERDVENDRIADFLYSNPQARDELSAAYAQQEP
jgi:hypothetical protein